MTREEAIKGLKVFRRDFGGYKPNEEMFDMAIKALEQEPCDDCVSRKAVLEMAKSYNTDGWDMYTPLVVDVEDIEELPSVTPIRPKGHWIGERNDYGKIEHWHCSNCYDDSGFTTTCKWDFCPSCGADMRGIEE